MLKLYMLPAGHGDSLWLEYGLEEAPGRMLIDCGTAGTADYLIDRIAALPKDQRYFDLLVITHIDDDHIGGALPLLKARHALGLRFGEIWFNGYRHLQGDMLGPNDGDKLTAELLSGDLFPLWNRSMQGGPVVVPEQGMPPTYTFGELDITLLSPFQDQLHRLARVWTEECNKAGIGLEAPAVGEIGSDHSERADMLGHDDTVDALLTRTCKPDGSRPNGSSIAFLARHGDDSILFGGDAFAGVLHAALCRLHPVGALAVSAFKLSHHGSKANLTLDVLEKLACRHFLFSTNGGRSPHPDKETIARIITAKPYAHLHFNYRSPHTTFWEADACQLDHGYTMHYVSDRDYLVRLE